MNRYIVVEANNLRQLEVRVEDLLKKGYEAQGGVQAVIDGFFPQSHYHDNSYPETWVPQISFIQAIVHKD